METGCPLVQENGASSPGKKLEIFYLEQVVQLMGTTARSYERDMHLKPGPLDDAHNLLFFGGRAEDGRCLEWVNIEAGLC